MADFLSAISRLELPFGNGMSCRFNALSYHDDLFKQYGVTKPAAIAGAQPKRRAEYLAGRYLCRELLSLHDLPFQVATGRHREPLWPSGWIGSISHSDSMAVAALAPAAPGRILGACRALGRESEKVEATEQNSSDSQANSYSIGQEVGGLCAEQPLLQPRIPMSDRLLGLDLEPWLSPRQALEIASLVAQPGELEALGSDWPREWLLTLVFSAKESLFKALYPQVGQYLDFNSALVTHLDGGHQRYGSFVIELRSGLTSTLAAGANYIGNWRILGEHVLTVIAESGSRSIAHQ